MKNLMLVRHAKSSWMFPLKDIDRPLETRGKDDAHLVSMNCREFLPEAFTLYSSTAVRATETARIFSNNLNYSFENIIFNQLLYTFDYMQLEKFIRSVTNSYDNIILFGHNDAITNFVNKFGDAFIENVPTCGFVSIHFNTDNWESLQNGRTTKTIFPKDLK